MKTILPMILAGAALIATPVMAQSRGHAAQAFRGGGGSHAAAPAFHGSGSYHGTAPQAFRGNHNYRGGGYRGGYYRGGRYYGGYYPDYGYAAGLGFLAGAALADPYYDYGYAPYYGYGGCDQWVWDPRIGQYVWGNVCY